MKIQKVIGTIISAAMCFLMFTFGVSAAESVTELSPVTVLTEAETVDVSQLLGNTEAVSIDVDCDTIQLDLNENNVWGEFDTDISDILADINAEQTITPRASANPVSSLRIKAIGLGNTSFDPFGQEEWENVPLKTSSYSTEVSCNIDTTDYTYICVRVLQWGYTSSTRYFLDDVGYTYSREVCCYNALGQVITGAGEVVYGFLDDYIFKIPKDKTNSTLTLTAYYKSTGAVVETKGFITWKTPTGPAPTTPTITYNPAYEDAIIEGIDNTMEYRLKVDNGTSKPDYTNWISFTGTEILAGILDMPYTVQIRYKNVSLGNPSEYMELPVKTRSEAPSEYADYYYIDEVFAIYDSDRQLEVAFGDGTRYIPISGQAFVRIDDFIDGIPTGGFNNIYVRYRATGDEPASYALIFKIYARNPQVPNNVYYENGILHNLTPDMIFSFNGSEWYSTKLSEVNVTAFMSSTETTLLEIRYAATETTSNSAIYTLTLPALSE